MGIETEYGIAIQSNENADPVAESIALIQRYRPDDPTPKWDYSKENPFKDALDGKRKPLQEHPDEKAEQKKDADRNLSFEEVKSDRILFNGARLYNDHAHPEYSTPECRSLFQLVAHDKAGERILLQCARRRSEQLGDECVLYKNNTDFRGHSYGCHDNYLMDRGVPFPYVRECLLPFNATRQIFAGAGKMGVESERGMQDPAVYQISPTRRLLPGQGERGHHAQKAARQHARRTARRCEAVPAAARHRRGREHVRIRNRAQDRNHRPRHRPD